VRIASNARMRSHSRFPCPLCPQCLTTKGGLRNHFNSHIGLKRFNCSERNCGKAFTTKWVCTRHERTVHGLLR
jgi:huckebein